MQIKEALVSSQRLWQDLQAPFRYEQEKTARISYLASQDEIRQKELETRQVTETSEAETMVAIERIKQGKQTEALDLRLAEEATRFTREQESARQKIQLEEQTTLIKRESDQRLEIQAARAEQERTLEALRRSQAAAIERTRLDAEASARQKALQVEQALQELAEETRLATQQLQANMQQIERETALKQQDSALKLLLQEQAALLEGRVQEAGLARTRQETLAQLELQEAANRVTIALAEREAEIDRRQQEIRNLINERDLSSRHDREAARAGGAHARDWRAESAAHGRWRWRLRRAADVPGEDAGDRRQHGHPAGDRIEARRRASAVTSSEF